MSGRKSPGSQQSSSRRLRFFPKNWNDRSLIYFCALLASLAGLVVISIGLYKSHRAQRNEADLAELNKDWIENLIPKQPDLIDVLLQDVTPQRTLVLFENGTVAIVREPSENPKEQAIEILKKNASPSSIFAVNKVGQDYAIRYQGTLFTRLSGNAVGRELRWIDKHWKEHLTDDELNKINQSGENPKLATQIGLISRSFLMRDLKSLKVTKILKAQTESSE